jgi:putative hydrolase of the HAD superfamily
VPAIRPYLSSVVTDPRPRTLTASRAVLFDFGGTLDADGQTWKDRVGQLWREEGLVVTPERFDPAFYAADDALVGTVSPTLPFLETVSRLVAGVASGLGLRDSAVVERIATRFVTSAMATARRNAPLLSTLARRYRLGVVSNFYGNLATVCDNCGILESFSVVIDSARVACVKPDPRIFQAAVEALGVSTAEAIFVGDSPSRDMAGARGVGMPHIWLAAEASQRRGPCCPGDPVVRSLSDLGALLL